MAFGPSGELLATGSEDKTAVVWELSDGEKLAEFQHDYWVWSVVFSPDGELLASGYWDGVFVWKFSDGRKIAKFSLPAGVWSVVFSPDGELLATDGGFKAAVVWDLSCRKKLTEFPHDDWVKSVDFSPDGKYLASGGENAYAIVWAIPKGKNIAEFQHDDWVYSVDFSPDGRYLAYCGCKKFCIAEWKKSKSILTERHDRNVWRISWFKRMPAYIMKGILSPFAELPGKGTWSMALSRRGFLALGHGNGLIEIIREGKEI